MQKKRRTPRRRAECMTHESWLPQSWHITVEFDAVSAVSGVDVDDGRCIVSVSDWGKNAIGRKKVSTSEQGF